MEEIESNVFKIVNTFQGFDGCTYVTFSNGKVYPLPLGSPFIMASKESFQKNANESQENKPKNPVNNILTCNIDNVYLQK